MRQLATLVLSALPTLAVAQQGPETKPETAAFVPNQGQWPDAVRFRTGSGAASAWLITVTAKTFETPDCISANCV